MPENTLPNTLPYAGLPGEPLYGMTPLAGLPLGFEVQA